LESGNVLRTEGQIGGLASFNAEHGYIEAMLRGFRSGFLKSYEYRQLCQCETFDDFKLCLGDTDYLNVLQNTSRSNWKLDTICAVQSLSSINNGLA